MCINYHHRHHTRTISKMQQRSSSRRCTQNLHEWSANTLRARWSERGCAFVSHSIYICIYCCRTRFTRLDRNCNMHLGMLSAVVFWLHRDLGARSSPGAMPGHSLYGGIYVCAVRTPLRQKDNRDVDGDRWCPPAIWRSIWFDMLGHLHFGVYELVKATRRVRGINWGWMWI